MGQMKSILAAAVALAMTSVTASAQEADTEKSEKKICRTEKATGSLTRRTRICLTETQWRELNDRTRRGVDEMNREAAGGTNTSAQFNGAG